MAKKNWKCPRNDVIDDDDDDDDVCSCVPCLFYSFRGLEGPLSCIQFTASPPCVRA